MENIGDLIGTLIIFLFFQLFIKKYFNKNLSADQLKKVLYWQNIGIVVYCFYGLIFIKSNLSEISLPILIFILYAALNTFPKNNRTKLLAWAFIPYASITIIVNLFSYWVPKFYNSNKEIFETPKDFSFLWLIGFTIYLYRGAKNEQKIIEKAENEKRILEDQNADLENIVSKRTAELNNQNETLQRSLIELKNAQNQLVQKEKMASLGELTAGIAHEIQNPLNFVNNFSEVSAELCADILEEFKNTTPNQAYLQEMMEDLMANNLKINHHGKRASSIVKGMLAHSRNDTADKENIQLNDLIDEYMRLAYHGYRAKEKGFNCTLETEFDVNIPTINVVSQDLGRIFINIFNNAFYAIHKSKKTGVLKVKTLRLLNNIEITIEDNGIGMEKAIKDKIFQPFFTTKPTGEGTGLGLSLTYEMITKSYRGTLELESEPNIGTILKINLPIQ